MNKETTGLYRSVPPPDELHSLCFKCSLKHFDVEALIPVINAFAVGRIDRIRLAQLVKLWLFGTDFRLEENKERLFV
jgi:hypothetical protein